MRKILSLFVLVGSLTMLSGCSLSFVNQPEKVVLEDGQEFVQDTTASDQSDEVAPQSQASPLDQDSDGDGLSDIREEYYHSDPNVADTDGDGYSDGDEVAHNYNPVGEGALTIKSENVSLDALATFGHFEGLTTIKIDLVDGAIKEMSGMDDANRLKWANQSRPGENITDPVEAERIVIEFYQSFPHYAAPKTQLHDLSYIAFADFEYFAVPFLKENKEREDVVRLMQYMGFGADGGFLIVPSDGVYKFRQFMFGGEKCGGGAFPKDDVGLGFIDGLITSDSKLWFIGGGCYEGETFNISSLAGYIWNTDVFRESSGSSPKNNSLSGEAGARDNKRVADIKQIQTALQMYYNEFNHYPETQLVKTGEQIAGKGYIFLYSVPAYPLPADGDCGQYSSEYVYNVDSDGQNYSLEFCLGGAVNNLKPGMHIANVDGIK